MTPRQGLDAGAELGEGVGLDQVVVAAGLQARHPVLDLAQGRQEQHRRAVPIAAQGLDHGHAVHARHHPVHHHDVEALLAGHVQALGAVLGEHALVARLPEAARHRLGRLHVVFNDEYPHVGPPADPSGRGRNRALSRPICELRLDLDRDEDVAPAAMDLQEHAGAACLLGRIDRADDVGRGRRRLVEHPHDHVAALQALFAGVGGRLDALDHHAVDVGGHAVSAPRRVIQGRIAHAERARHELCAPG